MIIGYMEQIDRHSAEDEKTETMRGASVCRQSKLHDCPKYAARWCFNRSRPWVGFLTATARPTKTLLLHVVIY